jgi:hypothetical protein
LLSGTASRDQRRNPWWLFPPTGIDRKLKRNHFGGRFYQNAGNTAKGFPALVLVQFGVVAASLPRHVAA